MHYARGHFSNIEHHEPGFVFFDNPFRCEEERFKHKETQKTGALVFTEYIS